MPLTAGTRLGSYVIEAQIGVGGMGEVYRARDTKLNRDVALKILPAAFAADPDRLARFRREAHVLASLNHPNIAQIHGFEDSGPTHALVMELVEGPTLADRIAAGPVVLDETLLIARQIADALEAAHEQGIIHRDLKPANIKVTPGGVVKVLDFGLAKAAVPESDSPHGLTVTGMNTEVGMLLGTAAYMSPEQARGQAVDKRTDIWAFGCVLYEMLAGRPAFGRDTVSDTIAGVLEREPDWTSLRPETPPPVTRLLRRCLEKNPRARLRDLGDWEVGLEQSPASTPTAAGRSWVAWAAVAVSLAAVGLLVFDKLRVVPLSEPPPVRFEIPPIVSLAESGTFAVSPDGRHLVFAGTGADGILRLWIRSLDALETRPLLGTETELVTAIPPMIWSPDSRFIAFWADGKLKKVERSGGAPQALCDAPGVAVGGSWNHQDVILVGNTIGGLLRCPAGGGDAVPVTKPDPSAGSVNHLFPSFLPDGRHFIYLTVSRTTPSQNGLFIGDLQVPPDRQKADRLLTTGFGAAYVPATSGLGHVLFVRDGALLAVPFNADTLALGGEPVRVAESVGAYLDGASYTTSASTLVYRKAPPDYQLTLLDRKGGVLGRVGEPGTLTGVALSPDGTQAIVTREIRLNRADRDLWLVDIARSHMTKFTSDSALESLAAWSADGTHVIYAVGTRGGDFFRKAVNGSRPPEVLLRPAELGLPINTVTTTMSTSADDRFLVFTVETSTGTKSDLWILPFAQRARAFPLVAQEFDQIQGQLSPDGRWIAYVSNESGANEVFVRPLKGDAAGMPTVGSSQIVSQGGGTAPRWRRDSRELFYQSATGAVMAISVAAQTFGRPTELFRAPGGLLDWGVTQDGQRFLLGLPTRQSAPEPFTVVLNWQSGLK